VFFVGYLYLLLQESGIEMDIKHCDCVGWIHLSADRQGPVAVSFEYGNEASPSLYVAALLIVFAVFV
jgi:predicted deacylase